MELIWKLAQIYFSKTHANFCVLKLARTYILGQFLANRYQINSDVLFIIDSSANVAANYHIIKQFLLNVISYFKFTGQQTRVGLILAGESASTVFKLSDQYTLESYYDGIKNMQLLGGSEAKIIPALQAAYNMLTVKDSVLRANIPKTLVLLTSSFNVETGKEKIFAKKFHQLGREIKLV